MSPSIKLDESVAVMVVVIEEIEEVDDGLVNPEIVPMNFDIASVDETEITIVT